LKEKGYISRELKDEPENREEKKYAFMFSIPGREEK